MKSTRLAYRAVFKNEDGKISVVFPELPGCVSQGDSIEDAIFMARDALGVYLSNKIERDEKFPPSSHSLDCDSVCGNNEFAQFVDVDLKDYVIKIQSRKPIKKTLNIPEWLNVIVEKYDINYSNLFKKALIHHLRNEEERLRESEKYLLDVGLAYYT